MNKRVMDQVNLIKGRLHSVKQKHFSHPKERGEEASKIADSLLELSSREMTWKEKKERMFFKALIEDPHSKAFLVSLVDQSFRSKKVTRTSKAIRGLIHEFGIPKSLSLRQRLAFRFFHYFALFIPFLFVPYVHSFIKKLAKKVVFLGDKKELSSHLAKRIKEGFEVNLDRVRGSLLGEEQVEASLKSYLEDIKSSPATSISLRLSCLSSHLKLLNFEEILLEAGARLRLLYREALKSNKRINLDVEGAKEVDLALKLFKRILDEEEFLPLSAGLVIQAYLPTATALLADVIDWAAQRHRRGGAPVGVSLVKGSNLGMERVEASLRGWPQSPFETKVETDSQFIRLLHLAIKKEHGSYLRVGVGTHHLFDIAYGLILTSEEDLESQVVFEMFEGIGAPELRVLNHLGGNFAIYTPLTEKEDFQSTFSSFMRKFDESTAKNHFLRTLFTFDGDTSNWERERKRFFLSLSKIDDLDLKPRRTQNRFEPPYPLTGCFRNEPTTDFSLLENRKWVESHLAFFLRDGVKEIPSLIGGKIIEEGRDRLPCFDPSFPETPLYAALLATVVDGEKAVKASKEASEAWSNLPLDERSKILLRVTQILRNKRGELVATLVADGGKTVQEADLEISEAIDFGEYYIRSCLEWHALTSLSFSPKGLVLIASSWSFPLSVPAGEIFAALIAGNGVIFKPSLETPLIGWRLAHCFWEGGVPRDLLAFVVGQDATLGTSLVQNDSIGMVVLTGSKETARSLLNLRPGVDLVGKTGGKNSMIVTGMADRDLAIAHIIHSAFSHSGQKNSALGLLILEEEVYRDKKFRQTLLDAVKSLKVGSSWDLGSEIVPLIRPPSENLRRALSTLEEGEEWLLKPDVKVENPNLYSPGIKWGVKEGSFLHQTELLGPLLGVISAKNLDHAISIANGTPYGLAAGLHSLDRGEQEYWRKKIRAGNLYINRPIVDSLVGRQPLGGCKASYHGLGPKTGGPNYLSIFSKVKEKDLPLEREPLSTTLKPLLKYFGTLSVSVDDKKIFEASLGNYQFWWNRYFSQTEDLTKLLGQRNFYYYVPYNLLVLRVELGDSLVDVFRSISLCLLTSGPYELSVEKGLEAVFSDLNLLKPREFRVETASQFLERMKKGYSQRVRKFSPPDSELVKVFARGGTYLSSNPVVGTGRWEFLYHLREVSLSCDTHRYGNLGVQEEDVSDFASI